MNTSLPNRQVKFNKSKVQLNDFYVKLNLTNVMDETFGQWLRKQRKARSYSQDVLAERSRVSKTYISLLESDKVAQPRLYQIDKIAKALNVPIAEVRQAAGLPLPASSLETISDDEAENVQLMTMYAKQRKLTPKRRASFKRMLEMVDRELDRELLEQIQESGESANG